MEQLNPAIVTEVIPSGEDTLDSEVKAVLAFIRSHGSTGNVPARQPYLETRDESFIQTWCVGAIKTKYPPHVKKQGRLSFICTNLEDAREAIYVGKKAGYHDEDIAAYLVQNYHPARLEAGYLHPAEHA